MRHLSGSGITALGVRRPILITVWNLLIMLAGLAAWLGLDIRELPNVDRPVIGVQAVYEGASPETMDTEVTSIVEGAIARVSGIKNIESSSEQNNMRIRAEFDSDVALNDAANDVREAISRVQQQLPENMEEIIVVKADADADAVIQLSAYSTSLSQEALAERIEKDVAPALLSVKGVADVFLSGNRPRIMRIALDPAKMAAQRVSVPEIAETLRNARFDVPAGSYTSSAQELVVRSYATVTDTDKIEQLLIRENTRIGDVAEAYYTAEEAEAYTLMNGRPVIGLGIIRQAGSNTILIAEEIRRRVAAINAESRDMRLVITSDNSIYIENALQEVVISLAISVLVVLLVMALFLGQWRTVLIPAVTMPVSLIGTLAALWVLGFSLNLLTLLALVLATGLIVDDAIVVLENIERRRHEGLEKMAAAVLGTRQVFFAVIATTATLVAVFVPIAFLPGDIGKLFREFAYTLAIAVIISSFVAITLCPMIAARLPYLSTQTPALAALRSRLEKGGSHVAERYFHSLRWLLSHRFKALAIAIVTGLAGLLSFTTLDNELLPPEDRGMLVIMANAPDGAALDYSQAQADKIEAVLRPYKEQGLIQDIYAIIGWRDKNRVLMLAQMSDWEERSISQMEFAKAISSQLNAIPAAQIRIIQGNGLNRRGSAGGELTLAVLGNDYNRIFDTAEILADKLRSDIPAIQDIRVKFDTSQPQLSFEIDRQKADDLDVPLDRIAQTLQVMTERLEVLDISVDDVAVPVVMRATEGAVRDPADILNVFVTNRSNQIVPLSALGYIKEEGVAAQLDRFAQRRAIELDIGLKPDAVLGDVVAQIKANATDIPEGQSLLFLGEAADLEAASNDIIITFALAFIIIFLVLAAQFESIGSAVIVMFTVPFGLTAAVFALLLTGQSFNLYSQIGLVMLVGLITKNAILLVEFMDQLRDEGLSIDHAIMQAVQVRLRPLMMTIASTVLGALPLILSTGAGAEARNAIGWVIFGGLGLSTLFTLYLAPLGYALIAPYVKPRSHAGEKLEAQLAKAEAEGVRI